MIEFVGPVAVAERASWHLSPSFAHRRHGPHLYYSSRVMFSPRLHHLQLIVLVDMTLRGLRERAQGCILDVIVNAPPESSTLLLFSLNI